MFDKKELLKKELKNAEDIKPLVDEILSRKIDSLEDMKKIIKDYSLLMAFISEKIALAYIDMTCNTNKEEKVNFFQNLYGNIVPYVEEKKTEIYKKLKESKYWDDLGEYYNRYKQIIEAELKTFNKDNLKLMVESQQLTGEYGQLTGNLMIDFRGEKKTVQQMGIYLKDKDRETRKEAWIALSDKRLEISDKVSEIYDKLVHIRHNMAKNAGFNDFIDYTFVAKRRFDYTKEDCLNFHMTVKENALPYYERVLEKQKKRLGIDTMKPWDKLGVSEDDKVLKPFSSGKELLDAVINIFDKIDTKLGDNLRDMLKNNLFDLESREGKAPGGYNYPLELQNKPFIFMNSTGLHRDLVTLLHEGGHATHTYLTGHIEETEYRETPSEIAELASMSMELISMDYWDTVYTSDKDLRQAKREQIEGIIKFFPWAAIVDRFQFFVYQNPEMSMEERNTLFDSIFVEFGEKYIDWSDIELKRRQIRWQEQIHIIEVPFYYIEYAFSQLGAVQVWMNYRKDPKKAVEMYLDALRAGNTLSIKGMYERAGIKFDFSKELMTEIMTFLENELESLE